MFSCSNCHLWIYHHPNRMGVCCVGPDEVEGTVAPVSADGVGMQLAIEWAAGVATTPETVCNNWEPVDEDALEDEEE